MVVLRRVWILHLVLCALQSLLLVSSNKQNANEYPTKSIRQCVDDTMKGRRFMKKTNTTLHLDFGDPAIEMFNILSTHDIMMVRTLEHCVRTIIPEMFHDRISIPTRNFTHGGSNVTYLTGIFQQILPDLHIKIATSTIFPMSDSHITDYWIAPLRSLGIRSVYFEAFANIKPGLTKEQRRELRYAKYLEEKNKQVWLGKPSDEPFIEDESEEEEMEYEFDEHADEHLEPYLQHDSDSVYKTIMLLSDRSHFSGGEMYLKREKEKPVESTDQSSSGPKSEDDEDAYEEELEDVGEVIDEKIHGIIPRKKKISFPKYNARTSKVARYTPEKGSVLLMRTDYSNGMGTLHRGKRLCLVIEYWPYADSALGSKILTIKEALPLPQRWSEL